MNYLQNYWSKYYPVWEDNSQNFKAMSTFHFFSTNHNLQRPKLWHKIL